MQRRVIKQAKHTEHYQREKLRGGLHAACLSVREATGSAELTVEQVCDQVEAWLEDKYEVTSADLRRVASQYLHSYNPAAAYVYATHKEVN